MFIALSSIQVKTLKTSNKGLRSKKERKKPKSRPDQASGCHKYSNESALFWKIRLKIEAQSKTDNNH
jgi:hypothetical protein